MKILGTKLIGGINNSLASLFFSSLRECLLSRTTLELITGEIHQPTLVTGCVTECFISLQLNISDSLF